MGFFLFFISSFSQHKDNKCNKKLTINGRSVDGVLGTWTRTRGILGADKYTELWRSPTIFELCLDYLGLLKIIQTF